MISTRQPKYCMTGLLLPLSGSSLHTWNTSAMRRYGTMLASRIREQYRILLVSIVRIICHRMSNWMLKTDESTCNIIRREIKYLPSPWLVEFGIHIVEKHKPSDHANIGSKACKTYERGMPSSAVYFSQNRHIQYTTKNYVATAKLGTWLRITEINP